MISSVLLTPRTSERTISAINNFGKIRGLLELTAVTLLFLLAAVTVNAQQISGTPGSH